ncbi:LOW QUALITY PROTEIN: uncharacterized protein C1orf167 homolog [Molossus nigricans]
MKLVGELAAGCGVDQGHCCHPGFALEPMEQRPDTSHKENVPPRPPTPLKPGKRLKQRRRLKSPGVLLSSGRGRWVPTGQAGRREPATTPSPGVVFLQEPCRVQTNLARPVPRLGPALKDMTGRLISPRFQQQSNLQPLGVPRRRAARTFAVQQSNLGTREALLAECGSRGSHRLWSEPQESHWPHRMPPGSPLPGEPQAHPPSTLKQPRPLATDTPCLGFRPTARYAHVRGHAQPGSRSWSGLENWTSRLLGESLTLEDLAVPVKSQAGAPSQASISQLLASVQRLEHEAARRGRQEPQRPPGPSQQEPRTSDGQALPACPQPSQPGLVSWDEKKIHPRAFLLWCYQKEWARREKGVRREASGATLTQSMGRPPQARCSPAADAAWVAPLAPQPQRACLRRCFGAWQQLGRSGAQYQERRADQMGALRMCLRQWMWMKQLRAAGGAKLTRLSLYPQKDGMWSLLPGSSWGNMALCSSGPGGATSHGLGWVAQAQGLPQGQGPRLAFHPVPPLWKARLAQRQRANSFCQGMQHRMLRRILQAWHSRVWDRGTPSDSTRTIWALEPLGSVPGGEGSLGCNTPRSSLDKASRAPALLDTLRRSFLWAAGRQQGARCLLLGQARAQRSQRAARWHQHTLWRRVLLSWSHWAVAQGAQRELAALWACDRSRRAALGLWRRRLEQRREAEQRAGEQGPRLRPVRDALQRWPSCWQTGPLRCPPFAAIPRPGVDLRETQGCSPSGIEPSRMSRGDGHVQGAQAQQAFVAWRVALGQCCEARQPAEERARTQAQVALCWTLWEHESRLHRLSRAHAARKLSARVLEAWAQSAAQGRVQRVAITQFQQTGHRHLLRTHWAQWRTALLRVWLESQKEAPKTGTAHPRPSGDLRQWPRLASRGRLLVLLDTVAPWKQATVPSSSGCSGLDWPAGPGPAPPGPGGDCSSETSAPKGQGQVDSRWLASGCAQGLFPHPQEEIPAALARGTAPPAPGLPAGQAPGSNMAALGRCPRGRGAGMVASEWGVTSVSHLILFQS